MDKEAKDLTSFYRDHPNFWGALSQNEPGCAENGHNRRPVPRRRDEGLPPTPPLLFR
jgi:hypothetical protein